ncbi:FAD-dependent oxidoreductase [Pandoraea sp.]|uniref:FAD-dependent oxidoreductase n=1 Tax=Pandoraea sp. TaxID=1883445 RepID=UPI001200654B|nr:FAD-dependent oxidoreductase [Pandoraea sp.]TAL54410.1 MAG: FAD-dependent oxidoreductase [Pandoraea sp.]TAM17459.1 MAG: FAD-dependent oxidoreductase [Pandoraea sp.]
MLSTYTYPRFAYRTPPELQNAPPQRHPVVVIGAGPIGLATAIDLAQQGVPVIVVDDDETVSVGSRGLCYAKRTLEILDRLGCGEPVVKKGVSWHVGRVFFGSSEVYNFELLPEPHYKRPAMVNLQQYYLEQYLVERAQQLTNLDLRWQSKVTGIESRDDQVTLQIETAEGSYALEADWVIACDGARSPVRRMLGLDIEGKIFKDRFLIADVVMNADFPAERWFWFTPPFHSGQSVLLHREADNVWRIDFQLGWDADPEEEKKPENVIPRIRAMLGPDVPFELEWVSVYTFQCRRMPNFRHGRVLFAGDSAHQVSPFGARGANSGIQDADNLAWKLKLVLDGRAPERLLDSYCHERGMAADENLRHSTRSTDFITPKSAVSRLFRDATLLLAKSAPFARSLVNSGRLSVATLLHDSPLNTPDASPFPPRMAPGAPLDDAPVTDADGRPGWLIDHTGNRFVGLYYAGDTPPDAAVTQALAALAAPGADPVPVEVRVIGAQAPAGKQPLATLCDVQGVFAQRYDARPGTFYLVRPDQHVCARWRQFDAAQVRQALRRALCLEA